ncbi:hypothetical protein EYF80_054229 [Liparis tanakae]|uniref:Uncharacterized protein n=1 Tax=Liparis tanakae TaxID=230148 RepID=A0A4Z2F3H9_9TELE|nr:hypothetical protein EYF80_054229 [Liparis tanakae]
MYIISKKGIVLFPTWWDAGGDGGGGQLSLSFGGHSRHFYGVGGVILARSDRTCEDAVLFPGLTPADFERRVQDLSEAEILPGGCVTARRPAAPLAATGERKACVRSRLLSSCVLPALGGLRGPSPGVVKHSTEV